MKFAVQYIAYVLLAVFAVTFVPFNLLHHHAEHEHAAVMLAHQHDAGHHCALDDHFCQQDIESDCGHESHIQQTLTKCFSCTFHFIKHFETYNPLPVIKRDAVAISFRELITGKLRQAIIRISNKGPPQLT